MLLFSLGCGIGYGYLHRIPTKPDKTENPNAVSIPGQKIPEVLPE